MEGRAGEWAASLSAIDAVIRDFFRAFDNRRGPPDMGILRRVMASWARVGHAAGDTVETTSLEAFLEPRQALLTDGSVTDFHEWEVHSRTCVFGPVATRVSYYAKQGIASGTPFAANGYKMFQLWQQRGTWRIEHLSWADRADGLEAAFAGWSEQGREPSQGP